MLDLGRLPEVAHEVGAEIGFLALVSRETHISNLQDSKPGAILLEQAQYWFFGSCSGFITLHFLEYSFFPVIPEYKFHHP